MPFETVVTRAEPAAHRTPLLAIAVPRGGLPTSLAALDKAVGGMLGRLYAAGDFTGKKDELAVLYPSGPADRLVLIGIGKPEDVSTRAIRRAASIAAKRARMLGASTGAFVLCTEARASVSPRDAAQATAEGLAYGAWHYPDLKLPPEEPKPALERLEVLVSRDAVDAEAGHSIGAAIAAGQTFTRGLQVLPGNMCTPSYLADRARELAAAHGFDINVLDKAAIEREGMGALLAVSQGSAQEPRFIALEYAGADGPPVVLVGKGVTFDTGGISIKPAERMEDMKFDMSGAAAVLGAFEALGRLRPKVRVIGLIPSAENMPSGTAYRPGDVVKSHLGKHIEVINTDAEGRMLLCDALSYARRYQPAAVLDIATLTGAIVIALGHTAAGVMGTDDALVEEVRSRASVQANASGRAGDDRD
jgi:leucyl aminopeptidase